LRLVRLLLRIYPPDFRARHGSALLDTIESRFRADVRALGRARALMRLSIVMLDLMWGGFAERTHAALRRDAYDTMRRRSMPTENIVSDLRVAVRGLRRAPAHAMVAIATLAVGVGACVALFSVLNAVVLKPLPFEEPDRIAHLWTRNEAEGTERYFVSPMDLDDWRTRSRAFETIAGYWRTQHTLTGEDGDPERLRTYLATWDLFAALGVTPLAGRTFGEADGQPGAEPVAVISEGLWRRRFGADPGVVGRTAILDGSAREVIGIVRSAQVFPNDAELWTNINFPLTIQGRNARWLSVVARLSDGVTLEAGRAEMLGLAAQLAAEHPQDAGWSVTVLDLRSALLGDARLALLLLFGAAGVVLLVACANVAGMTLVRAQERVREMAVRASLGATRLRIAAQLLVESLVLAVGGAAAGLLLALVLLRALPAVVVGGLPRVESAQMDGAGALVATACIALTALVLGLAPAFQLSGIPLAPVLTEGSRATGGRGRARLRSLFVIAQLMAAVVLVTGAIQLARSFGRLLEIDPGFDPSSVVTMELDLQEGYDDFAAAGAFYRELEPRIAALPGVSGVGLTTTLPLDDANDYFQPIELIDAPVTPTEAPRAYLRQVSADFFQTLRVPILRGRAFTPFDRIDTGPVAIVNEAFVRRYLGAVDPIGRHVGGVQMQIGPLGVILNDEVEIIGVAADVKYDGLRDEPAPSLYFPMEQAPFRRMILVLRTTLSTADATRAVRGVLQEMNPRLPLSDIATLRERVDIELAPDRRNLLLIGGFGSIALLLAGVGVFGVVSYSARQRIPEFGIRLAVGAGPAAILGLVMDQAVRLVGIGLALGLIVAFPAMRLLASQLYGVSPGDPLAFLGVGLLLAGTGVVAGLIPAVRATRMDPLKALRSG
jgi:predicted permease